jgi:SagB-type dehydrogenase family enzyme
MSKYYSNLFLTPSMNSVEMRISNFFPKLKYKFLMTFGSLLISPNSNGEGIKPDKSVSLKKTDNKQIIYQLPDAENKGNVSVEEALCNRRSHRSYLKTRISAQDLSQILWAAYGITRPLERYPEMRGGLRSAPSAGARYPLEIYVFAGNVSGMKSGVYKYVSQSHTLVCIIDKDMRKELSVAALYQKMLRIAPACLLFCAVFDRTTQGYGERGQRYVFAELGHSAQNVYLQAEALHLGTCATGAFNDDDVRRVIPLPDDEEPLYLMPIGYFFALPEF